MKKKELILHLSYSDSKGGASIACFRIHKSIMKEGKYLSKILVKDHNILGEDIIPIYKSKVGILYGKVKSNLGRKIQLLQNSGNNILHSNSFFPSTLHRNLNKSKAKIIHLHWVQSDTISIKSIGKIKKPIVWTLHDSWPFCGCEHHPNYYIENRFQDGYNKNNKPKGNFGIDLDKWAWHYKVKNFKNQIYIVTPSKWMAKNVMSSKLMKNWKVKVIPNPVPDVFFNYYDINKVRRLFNLPNNKFLILFSGYKADKDFNKGFDLLEKILDYLDFLNKEKDIELILIGLNKKNMNLKKNIKTHFFSYISNIDKLSMLYSASNLICVTSRIENQCQIIAEAQAVGVPPIAFDTTGNSENIEHKKTGILIKPFDYKEFAESIIEIKRKPKIYNLMKNYSREFASLKYKSKNISSLYTNLYDMILNKQHD